MHVLMFMFTVSGVSRKYMMIMRIIVMVRNIIIAENDVRYKSIDNTDVDQCVVMQCQQ